MSEQSQMGEKTKTKRRLSKGKETTFQTERTALAREDCSHNLDKVRAGISQTREGLFSASL
eukprot:4458170-Prorocentrum_lima.AAC.1